MLARNLYYQIKPFIPRELQIKMRRILVRRRFKKSCQFWPIDERASTPPPGWTGWPDAKRFALVLTHDVEAAEGHDKCRELAETELRLGFRSSFNFVPEGYTVSPKIRDFLNKNGFEVGVHGLTHDGKLFSSRQSFQKKAARINQYLKQWNAVGFRSPAMHHNLQWMHDLNIAYDASTFDTDPFEPQPDGAGTIFPFRVSRNGSGTGYVELPYTLPQDFTLFVLFQEKSIEIWKQKLDWIADKGGMALLITHPDYMAFNEATPGLEEYPARFYIDFLEYVRLHHAGRYWNALPRDISSFWLQRR